MGSKDGERFGGQKVRGAVEITWSVPLRTGQIEGRPHGDLQLLMRRLLLSDRVLFLGGPVWIQELDSVLWVKL